MLEQTQKTYNFICNYYTFNSKALALSLHFRINQQKKYVFYEARYLQGTRNHH